MGGMSLLSINQQHQSIEGYLPHYTL